jgi:hypothetical protein
MSGEYQGYCNDCGWYGKGEDAPEAARFDALEHGHDDVEVHRAESGGGFFVMWKTQDGLGEDGAVHIH